MAGKEGTPADRRWKVLAVSPVEFQKVTDYCGGSFRLTLGAFVSGQLQQQHTVLKQFLRRCNAVEEIANMYLYDCGNFFVRFFVNNEELALMVLTIELHDPDVQH